MNTSIRHFLAALAGASALGFFSGAVCAAPITYDVTVNTSPYAGSGGNIDFQFNPGALSSPEANATITLFSPTGILQGAPTLDGGAAGTLATTATLTNSSGFNALFQSVIFGGSFSFRIAFDGAFLTSPSLDGTTFSLNLFDLDGIDVLGLADPAGNMLTGQLVNGAVSLSSEGAPVGNLPAVTFNAVVGQVPAPAMLWLLVFGLLAIRRTR